MLKMRLTQIIVVLVSATFFIQILRYMYSQKTEYHDTITRDKDKSVVNPKNYLRYKPKEEPTKNLNDINVEDITKYFKDANDDDLIKDFNKINAEDPIENLNDTNVQEPNKVTNDQTKNTTKDLNEDSTNDLDDIIEEEPTKYLHEEAFKEKALGDSNKDSQRPNKKSSPEKRKNILFLMADDLRPQLDVYEGRYFPAPIHPHMHTPNIDLLASRSLLLKRAYCQVALCCPSRTSILTGRRPDSTRVYTLQEYFRETGGNMTTIPQYFKEHGYTSIGIGKVFHPGSCSGMHDPISWSEQHFQPTNFWKRQNVSWQAVTKIEEQVKPLQDVLSTQQAIKEIKKFGSQNETKPFFLAVGFYRPHTPYIFPEKFLDFYPKNSIRPPANPFAPANMPLIGWNDYSLLRKFIDIAPYKNEGLPNKPLPLEPTLKVRRAYYASITYIDSLIGEILNELKAQNLHENTIVSFLGDHGYKLGEHGSWLKSTNFDIDTHAPMMISIPGLTDHGIETEELTEFVDLFPTLVEAAGLGNLPQCPKGDSKQVTACHEGSSLMPLITNPKTKWKKEVYFQYKRSPYMGYSMKNDGYRYTEWTRLSESGKPIWGDIKDVELYNHSSDPQENVNYADDVSYAKVKAQLSKQLRAGWRKSLPEN